MCSMHYSRYVRHGSTDSRPRWKDPEKLFWSKVDFYGDPDGCWLWLAHKDRDGYGLFSSRTLKGRAPRLAYLFLIGDLDPVMVMDHLCRNRSCVNPYHLEPVTPVVNAQRGVKGQQTHCTRGGHPLSGDNLCKGTKGRKCKRCHAERELARYHARTYGQGHGNSSGKPGQGDAA